MTAGGQSAGAEESVPGPPTTPAAAPDAGAEALHEPLPETVRVRVVALAADALGRLQADTLPPSLRRVATFAPQRRARLAGSQIAGVLERDADFRKSVAEVVREGVPELADAVELGSAPPAADPVDLAALAYLLRPDGWVGLVTAATDAVDADRIGAEHRRASGEIDALRARLDQAEHELKELRARHREQLATLKAENADLRRRLGEARSRARDAQDEAQRALAEASETRTVAASTTAAGDAEVRRARQRLEELERELAGLRRTERSGRDAATVRARLLLDTVVEAAQGLRRELSLPAVEGAPADQVVAEVAGTGSSEPSGHGSLASDDPALLDGLLAMPKVHLVVDGYNVTKAGWPDLTLGQQRDRLLAGLGPVAARSGAEVTVVFDAAETADRPPVAKPRGVRVLYSPVGVIADDVIRDLVDAEPTGRVVVVVSSDREVVRDVAASGARPVSSAALVRLLAR